MSRTQTRWRTDGNHFVAQKAAGVTRAQMAEWGYNAAVLDTFDAMPPVEPGDVWRIRWWAPEGAEGPVAGYAICCPRCRLVHSWTTASNCASLRAGGCDHSGLGAALGSCWEWSGSAENNLLTARPSLYASRACGWHGWLTDGVLIEC